MNEQLQKIVDLEAELEQYKNAMSNANEVLAKAAEGQAEAMRTVVTLRAQAENVRRAWAVLVREGRCSANSYAAVYGEKP